MTAEKCPVLIHYNFYSYRCDRPVKRSGKCGIHARADEARAESDRQRAAEREGSESRMQAAERAIAELADHGIAASPAYRGREAGYTGGVELNAAATQALLGQLDAAEAALARVRELHERWPIHGDGDHPEDCDCGDPWMTVCRLCCTDGKDQHETCAVYHDHGPDKPRCPTITAIGGEQS